MTKTHPGSVIFDVGNVLVRWDARRLFREFYPGEAAIDAFLDEVGFHEWNLAFDAGLPWEEGVAAHAARFPHHAPALRAFHERWHETVPGEIAGTVAILGELGAAGVPLYAITNFAGEKWAETVQRFPFLGTAFRDVVVSGHAGVTKPDPRIYRLLLERNGLDAEDCVFIDDSPANVAGAAALGIETILFTSPEALRRGLEERALLASAAPGGG